MRAPWTEDERRAAVTDAVARMDARLVHRMIQFNRWAIATALLLGAAIAGGVGAAGYCWGYRAAENRQIEVPAALGAALTARDAAVWLGLIRDNDIARVNRTCAPQNGREACSFGMWAEPMPPPRANGGGDKAALGPDAKRLDGGGQGNPSRVAVTDAWRKEQQAKREAYEAKRRAWVRTFERGDEVDENEFQHGRS